MVLFILGDDYTEINIDNQLHATPSKHQTRRTSSILQVILAFFEGDSDIAYLRSDKRYCIHYNGILVYTKTIRGNKDPMMFQ